MLRGELRSALGQLWPELEILAETDDGPETLLALAEHEPDVIFLDIKMPGMSGLEVARVASGKTHVTFVTAYDQYAIAAFEQGAVDYVMKPLSMARLAATVGRLRERLQSKPTDLGTLLEQLRRIGAPQRQFLRWITVAEGRTVRLITVDEICYFRADNKYTSVVSADGEWLISETIKSLLGELDPEVFLQIHRGTVVNINAIESIESDSHGHMKVRLRKRAESLPVSASFAHHFRRK
ncbi:MAG TPA: LytTR family DNA-binding domain-containing protein [Steroidobacteraceae bacterium]|nr:LytTR family DNA-binding domain-containing protein [Steroidobacteraceae bacterium]